MDIAIVTGASSSLGLAISRRLIQLGFRVYGLGGDYKDCPLQNVNFKPVPCDLADPVAVEEACRKVLEKEQGVYVLVNNAKYFGRSRYLDMDIPEMERILSINLLCPMVLIRNLAPSLKELQGYIIQLGTLHAESCRGGAAGAAASGGLKWMGDVLFHDLREHGVKVCHLSPEPNRGRDPRTTARPGARTESSIDPEALAQAVEQILQSPFGNVITELVMRPLRTREPEQDPVRKLPYPDPQPIPYTVPREMIEAEEQLEEEEWQQEQQEKRKRRRSRKAARGKDQKEARKGDSQGQSGEAGDKVQDRKERKDTAGGDSGSQAQQDSGSKPRRRSRRKPRPSGGEVGFHKKEQAAPDDSARQKQADQPSPRDSQEKPADRQGKKDTSTQDKEKPAKAPAKKAARKRTPRKSARKSAKPDEAKAGAGDDKEAKPARKQARKRTPKKAAKKEESGKDSA